MQTAEYRVQKHILCYNLTVSDIDLTTNFIDMRAPHQKLSQAFYISIQSIIYSVYGVIDIGMPLLFSTYGGTV